tara:strand:- start:577 stop:801 length:225 start_codon:yes stop_codon:yes gene_type:complete
MTIENEAMIRASGHFLTNEFPVDWQDMTEEELLKFILENEWCYFEGADAVDVWSHIENLAMDFISFAKKYASAE